MHSEFFYFHKLYKSLKYLKNQTKICILVSILLDNAKILDFTCDQKNKIVSGVFEEQYLCEVKTADFGSKT